jgi:ubiquinone/menaquinone biosynthesis C-methylase UbiE
MSSTDSISARRPTVHDHVTHFGLRLAKLGRRKYGGNHQKFYEEFFSEKHVHQALYDLRHRLRREAVTAALHDLIDKTPRPVLVDVGCGVGDIIRAIPDRWLRLAMLYSESDLRLARLQGKDEVLFVRGAGETIPLKTASVDAVICLEVIEHLPEDHVVIGEFSRILKPGGRLILSAPCGYYFADYLDLIGHHRHYSRQQLAELLQSSALRVIQYIDPQERVNAIHYYPYIVLQTLHQILNRLGRPKASLYVRPLVGRIYSRLRDALGRCRSERSQNALASDNRSTFVAAEKIR